MGYGAAQVADLEATIRRTPCDVVVIGTPIDLRRVVTIDQPSVRVTYDLVEQTDPDLGTILADVLETVRR
jgi:predicted GTPase